MTIAVDNTSEICHAIHPTQTKYLRRDGEYPKATQLWELRPVGTQPGLAPMEPIKRGWFGAHRSDRDGLWQNDMKVSPLNPNPTRKGVQFSAAIQGLSGTFD
jgi:hypothetical protein